MGLRIFGIAVLLAGRASISSVREEGTVGRNLLNIPSGLEDDLRPFIPDFTFRLIQLASLPFEAIRGTPAGILEASLHGDR